MIDTVKILFVWQKRNQFLEGNLVRKIDQYLIAIIYLGFFLLFLLILPFTQLTCIDFGLLIHLFNKPGVNMGVACRYCLLPTLSSIKISMCMFEVWVYWNTCIGELLDY